VAVDATRDVPTEHNFEITVESDNAAYHALAPLHYRPGTPATIVRVLAARVSRNDSCAAHQAPRRGELAGVLVVSMPTLNAGWRRFAWGDRFAKTNTAAGARRVNEELRCISRVIVDPRFRSRGVARALVRAYLDDPLTACTEALAAMGVACPFFERAGMTPYRVPPTGRDARLLDLFEQLGVERWRLATPRLAWVRLVDAAERHFGAAAGGQTLARELTRWARASRGTARFGDRPAAELFEIAAPAVIATPVAYAHRTGRR
jgi:GNAT superfamily N-acetyltransferase